MRIVDIIGCLKSLINSDGNITSRRKKCLRFFLANHYTVKFIEDISQARMFTQPWEKPKGDDIWLCFLSTRRLTKH